MCSSRHDALESTLALSLNKMKKGDFIVRRRTARGTPRLRPARDPEVPFRFPCPDRGESILRDDRNLLHGTLDLLVLQWFTRGSTTRELPGFAARHRAVAYRPGTAQSPSAVAQRHERNPRCSALS